jgi:4-aminobutyrate aminotransferase/(S)-3-amino-2-methylpropionate transaminase
MGPGRGENPPSLVYERAFGSNVVDVDGNRYVDLAAGFGAILLGHCHPELTEVVRKQAGNLTQALGDVFPSREKITLQESLARRCGPDPKQVILGQSGADAITAALKTAVLATGKPGVIAFSGAYHGLSYAPLALCNLRESYRRAFSGQLSSHVRVIPYPSHAEEGALALEQARTLLATGSIGAVVIEPLLGRGGCVIPPPGFLANLVQLSREKGALCVFDEIWTGLGRSGSFLYAQALGIEPDLICLGKGLGGGLPLSACMGSTGIMKAWQRDDEVVHTSTFAGTPLAASVASQLLTILERDALVERALKVGQSWIESLRQRLSSVPIVNEVRGRGFMIGIDLGPRPGIAGKAAQRLLAQGWITSTGGGAREVLVLTPPLTIAASLLQAATEVLHRVLAELDE